MLYRTIELTYTQSEKRQWASAVASGIAPVASAVSSVGSLLAADSTKLISMGVKSVGINSNTPTAHSWFGSQGPYTNNFINTSGQSIIVVVWGVMGSWINAVQPQLTFSLAPGASQMVSFANGAIGAWSGVYSDTQMVNGQLSNTWGEFTFSPSGVVDVSREVNMNGHSMSIQGPTCKSDMNTCVFVCSSGTTCLTGYQLLNCDPGSQPNANYGLFEGSPSGGCGGMGSSSAWTTTFS